MRKLLIVLALAALPIAGFAQATNVKITARGIDVLRVDRTPAFNDLSTRLAVEARVAGPSQVAWIMTTSVETASME